MSREDGGLLQIAEGLPEIMHKLFGRRLIASGAWELTIPQLRALTMVAGQRECSMGQLARSLGIGLSAATGLADRLVQHGLMEREVAPEDRRLVRLRLTEAGRRAREACRRERNRCVQEALRHLSAAERSRIAGALILLRKALDEAETGIPPGEEGQGE